MPPVPPISPRATSPALASTVTDARLSASAVSPVEISPPVPAVETTRLASLSVPVMTPVARSAPAAAETSVKAPVSTASKTVLPNAPLAAYATSVAEAASEIVRALVFAAPA